MKSLEVNSGFVSELNATNKNSFGKILVTIKAIENFFCSSTFYVRVSTGPYFFETKHITFKLNDYNKMKSE